MLLKDSDRYLLPAASIMIEEHTALNIFGFICLVMIGMLQIFVMLPASTSACFFEDALSKDWLHSADFRRLF
jgi:hypothetical protein